MSPARPLVWLVGASSGIGAALVDRLQQSGYRLAISARRAGHLQLMADAAAPGAIGVFPLDITDEAAVTAAVAAIETTMGDIGIVIINAGDYTPMPVEEFETGLFRRLVEVNYLGVVNCLAALLPVFKSRGDGQILVTASIAGYRGLPQAAPYCASKAATINLAEALRPELLQLGIQLRLINPGFVDTPLTRKNRFRMPFLMSPDAAARRIVKQLQRTNFEIAFPRRFVWLMKLMRCLPYSLYFPLVRRVTGS